MNQDELVQTSNALISILLVEALSVIVTSRIRFPYKVSPEVDGIAIAFIADDVPGEGSATANEKPGRG